MKILNPKFRLPYQILLVLLLIYPFNGALVAQEGGVYTPSVQFSESKNMCGLTYKEITDPPVIDYMPGGSPQPVTLKWYDSDMNVIPNETTSVLHTDVPGIYYFEQKVGVQIYTPQMVIVGYNVEWSQFQNTTAEPTGNSLQVTLPNGSQAVNGTGYSVNKGVLTTGSDQFVFMEVSELINSLGSSAINLMDNSLEVTWVNNSGLIWAGMTITNLGSQYKVVFSPSNNVFYDLSDGDNVLVQIDESAGSLNYRINGISKYTQALASQSNYITESNIKGHIHKKIDLSNSQNTTSAIYNCITSQPCSEIVYYELKRKMNAEYYWAYTDIVYFRYVEEYNDSDENLAYEIIGNSGAVILTSANSSHPQLIKSFGDNRFKLDVGSFRNVLPTGLYTMKVINAKSEVRFLKFRLN